MGFTALISIIHLFQYFNHPITIRNNTFLCFYYCVKIDIVYESPVFILKQKRIIFNCLEGLE